jgi:tripeptide aminopeptidase
MDKLLERFLQYVALDTQSKPGVRQVPSTDGQWKLLRLLQQQLEEMGLENVTLSEKGTVMATLPSTVDKPVPAIGFISHVDTSPDCSGKNVNPQILENYRGGDIALGIGDEILSPVMFPVLHQLLGQTLITTDGKTLLGADDKAGVAEIMTAMAVLKQKKSRMVIFMWLSPRTKRSVKGRSILTSRRLARNGPTPSTVAGWGTGVRKLQCRLGHHQNRRE